MAFRRKSSGPSPSPGLMPIDDIHGAGATQDHEPDATTGRLPAQDEDTSSRPLANAVGREAKNGGASLKTRRNYWIRGSSKGETMTQGTKDEVKGKMHEVKGKIKEKVGHATNNPNLEDEGTGEKSSRQGSEESRPSRESVRRIVERSDVTGSGQSAPRTFLRPQRHLFVIYTPHYSVYELFPSVTAIT